MFAPGRDPALERLLAYPYDIPADSYLWKQGLSRAPVSPAGALEEAWGAGRIPVVAIASNAAPAQLDRKLDPAYFKVGEPADQTIPVLRAEIPDVDIVYAAHVASYGSIPATAVVSPGALAHVFVTWLTLRQFDRINETEAMGRRYLLRLVSNIRCGGRTFDAPVYASMAGAYADYDSHLPMGLERVRVDGGASTRLTQPEVWDHLSSRTSLASNGVLLASQVLTDPSLKSRISDFLAARSIAGGLPKISADEIVASVRRRSHD